MFAIDQRPGVHLGRFVVCSAISMRCDKSPLFSGLYKSYLYVVIIQRIGVEHTDRLVGFALRAHGYIGIPLASARSAIGDDTNCCDISSRREEDIELLSCHGPGQIPYIQLDFHEHYFLRVNQ